MCYWFYVLRWEATGSEEQDIKCIPSQLQKLFLLLQVRKLYYKIWQTAHMYMYNLQYMHTGTINVLLS
jgi:hypothetical protein